MRIRSYVLFLSLALLGNLGLGMLWAAGPVSIRG